MRLCEWREDDRGWIGCGKEDGLGVWDLEVFVVVGRKLGGCKNVDSCNILV